MLSSFLVKRTFKSSLIKRLCVGLRKGKTIHSGAWTNWYEWVNVPINARELDREQSILLICVTMERLNHPKGRLDKKLILSNQAVASKMFDDTVKKFDRENILGKDLLPYIRHHTGINISIGTLYNWFPGFSRKLTYRTDEVIDTCKARSRNKKSCHV